MGSGETAPSRFYATLPATGTYTILVYLMRNEARRGRDAPFRLTVTRSPGR